MNDEPSTTSHARPNPLLVLCVSFLPLFAYWTCVYIIWPWHYYDCFDPEGIHFAGGLSILRGYGPGNVDNPATPLQTLSALLCWISGCGILDLERFRPLAYAVTIVLRIAAALVLIRYVLRDLTMPWQIALIWIPWMAPDFSMMSRQWCPETMYFPLGVLAIVGLYHGLHHPDRWQNAFLAGAGIGVMMGVKFIFVAWLAAAVLAIALTCRPLIAGKSCLGLVTGAVTGFVLATLPAVTRYPRMFEWLVRLATKTGQYGTGSSGVLDVNHVGVNLIEILFHQKAWMLAVAVIVAGLLIRKPRSSLAVFCVLAIFGSYSLVLKQFAPRYLAPTGLIVLLAAAELLRGSQFRLQKWSGPFAVVVAGIMIGKTLAFDVYVHRTFISERQESEIALKESLDRLGRTPDSIVLYGWRAFVPAFTVRFMSQGESHRFDEESDAAFPCEGLFNAWPDQLIYPAGKATWDFIVVGEDYSRVIDPEGLKALRQRYPSWNVNRYVVVKNEDRLTEKRQSAQQAPQ